jgi:hypothetical protein
MTPLHQIGRFVRDVLLQVPLPVARGLFVAVPLLVLIWVWTLPREQTTAPGSRGRWDGNLKLGATLALGAQVVIYLLL